VASENRNPVRNPVTVMKFGGTSLATPERIKEVAKLVAAERAAGRDVIAVVSAMGDTTDDLVRLARTISPSPPKREIDMLLTAGERISMALLSMAINELGYESISFTGSQSGIVTDTSHTRAKIVDVRAFRVRDELEKHRVVIVAGFQGVSSAKEVTTLGRGGSDTTAVALAAAFSADSCEIYTDVDGIFTADPNIVPWAKKIDEISYDEMLEMAFCGAQVLHSRSVEVARRFGVPVRVRSSFRKEMGTVVTSNKEIETADIRGIAQDLDAVLVSFRGVGFSEDLAGRVLETLEGNDINLRLVYASTRVPDKASLSFVISGEDMEDAVESLRKKFRDMEFDVDESIATVSVIGHGICSAPGVARTILRSLAGLGVTPHFISTSGITLTAVIPREKAADAIRKLHADLGLGQPVHTEEKQSGS
jgi:aspartate kinase